MKLRTLVIMVALLGILSGVAYFRNRPQPAASPDPRVGTVLLSADIVARAAGLAIADQGKKVELAKGADGTWRVVGYFGLPADFEKISRLVQDLNEAKVERFVTDNPERLSHLEFKDSRITLADSAGKEIWSLTLGKTPDSGNGRFIRFGDEHRAFFSGMHVWLDTDAKGWADAKLVAMKSEDVAKIGIPLPGGTVVELTRSKKDAPWTAVGTPAGQKLVADKVGPILTGLTGLRFSDTLDRKDPAAALATPFMRTFTLTSFDGTNISIALGRKPEVKKLKAPVADTTPLPATVEGKPEVKPVTPEFDTTPAGPVFAVVSSSDAHAAVNDIMAKRSFEVDDYAFTALPQKADDLFEAQKAK